jgi:hypothetical protein
VEDVKPWDFSIVEWLQLLKNSAPCSQGISSDCVVTLCMLSELHHLIYIINHTSIIQQPKLSFPGYLKLVHISFHISDLPF